MAQGKKASISFSELSELSKEFSDTQIAKKLNLAVSTVFLLRRKYGIPSYTQLTGKKQQRVTGKVLENGEGTPHKCVLSKESNYFKVINSPSKAYFLGLIASDGSLNYTKDKYFSIELKHPDCYVLNVLADEMETTSKLKLYTREDKDNTTYGRLRVYNREAVYQLKALGIADDNTKNKGFPELAPNLRVHYLRGLIDGDGCIKTETKTLNFGSCSIHLINTCEKWVAEEFNVSCSVTDKLLESGKPFYTVTFGGVPRKVLAWLYLNNEVTIARKKKEAIRWINEEWRGARGSITVRSGLDS